MKTGERHALGLYKDSAEALRFEIKHKPVEELSRQIKEDEVRRNILMQLDEESERRAA